MKRAWDRLGVGGVVVAVVVAGVAPEARANGRYPEASQLLVDPGDASHLVVRATYGTLHSANAGQSFGWVCEEAVGYGGVEDPMLGVLADGTILAGMFEGLAVSRDRGCSWSLAGGVLAGEAIADVVVQAAAPGSALVVAAPGTGDAGGAGAAAVYATGDYGKTWKLAGVPLDAGFAALTVEVARSDPQRIYVSGTGPGAQGVVARSDDGGATWQRIPFDLGGASGVWISAVDPLVADRVYARVVGSTSDRLVVSDDGGSTWSDVYVSEGALTGFALSPDGTQLAVGGALDGVQIASTADFQFGKTSGVGAQCLTWSAAGLYACAAESADAFTVGLSTDGGQTFQALYHLADTCPLVCAASTSASLQCGALWPGVEASLVGLGPSPCGSDGGAGGSAGADGGGGGGSGGATGSGAGSGAGSSAAAGGCAVARPGWVGLSAALALAAGALIAARIRSAGRGWRCRRPRGSRG